MKGVFIAIEGIDACGKGTVVNKLGVELYTLDKNNHVFLTREPYRYAHVTKLLSEKDATKRGDEALKLFVDDRIEHCKTIKQLIEAGIIVLSDRYKHSTYAYQMAQGVLFEKIHQLHSGLIVPDLTIIVDITAEEAIKRMAAEKRKQNSFEQREFLEKVRANYRRLKELLGENIVYVDGMRDRESVYADVKKAVLQAIQGR